MLNDRPDVFTLTRYFTPASDYPRLVEGPRRVKITSRRRVGLYNNYGARDYGFVFYDRPSERPFKITALEVDNLTAATDDPWRWWPLQRAADRIGAVDHVLVFGLGLGLAPLALLEHGAGAVTVIEPRQDVVAAIEVCVAVSERLDELPYDIVVRDYADFLTDHHRYGRFDALVMDCWVPGPNESYLAGPESKKKALLLDAAALLGNIPVYAVGLLDAGPHRIGEGGREELAHARRSRA